MSENEVSPGSTQLPLGFTLAASSWASGTKEVKSMSAKTSSAVGEHMAHTKPYTQESKGLRSAWLISG